MTIQPAGQAIHRVAKPARGSTIDGFGSDRRRSQRFPCKSTLAAKHRCIVGIVLRVLSVAQSDVGAGTVNFLTETDRNLIYTFRGLNLIRCPVSIENAKQ
jgi:hypothetical protein